VRHGNAADVSAKDGSQETAASLLGMVLGMAVAATVPITSFWWTLFVFSIFTALHILFNYKAVSAVLLDCFNKQRADICIGDWVRQRSRVAVAPPPQTPRSRARRRKEETAPTVLPPERLRDLEGLFRAHPMAREFGVEIAFAPPLQGIIGAEVSMPFIQEIRKSLEEVRYAVVIDFRQAKYFVFFSDAEVSPEATILAYFHAQLHRHHSCSVSTFGTVGVLQRGDNLAAWFEEFQAAATKVGWRFNRSHFRSQGWSMSVEV
jgi:hypothetical protein